MQVAAPNGLFFLSLGDHYRFLFGKYAGWAQSVIFCFACLFVFSLKFVYVNKQAAMIYQA